MASNSSRGNYYKKRSKEYYESLGYTVQITEFMCATAIKGRCFYRKIDIFGSDGIAMNGKELIFWNSKAVTGDRRYVSDAIREGTAEFDKYPFPSDAKLQLVIWEPRKDPVIHNVIPSGPVGGDK